jgi:hypothetical protein
LETGWRNRSSENSNRSHPFWQPRAARTLRAECRVVLTGSPMRLKSHLSARGADTRVNACARWGTLVRFGKQLFHEVLEVQLGQKHTRPMGDSMCIQHASRDRDNFYVFSESISEDRRLSWGARGLLIYLIREGSEGSISVSALIKETEYSSKPSGRDAVRALLGELLTAGYLTRIQCKSKSGTFGRLEYTVTASQMRGI